MAGPAMRLSFLPSVLLLVAGCARSPATAEVPAEASAAPIASRPNDAPSVATGAGVGVSCKVDADCPSLPCGPCTPGTAITREALAGPQCAVNPCRHSEAVCSAQHVCVVGPRAEKEPSVWRTPPASH